LKKKNTGKREEAGPWLLFRAGYITHTYVLLCFTAVEVIAKIENV
jgi:hypothetical protein